MKQTKQCYGLKRHLVFASLIVLFWVCSTCGGMTEADWEEQLRELPPLPSLSPDQAIRINVHEHLGSIASFASFFPALEEGLVDAFVFLGSPSVTLGKTSEMSFEEYEQNNDMLLRLAEAYPGRVYAFGTFPADAPDLLEQIQAFMERGGHGIKFYHGHSNFKPLFDRTIDDPRLDSVFSYLEQQAIPVIFHLNLGKYYDETHSLLTNHPNLWLDIPHVGVVLSSIGKKTMTLIDSFPHTYTDLSFGNPDYAVDYMEYFSDHVELIRGYIESYPDRFLFGSDQVVVRDTSEKASEVYHFLQTYRDMLAEEQYYNHIQEYVQQKTDTFDRRSCTMNGLALSETLLQKIFVDNPHTFLHHEPLASLP
jgi:predicted TIM-barrel fold metal-dependent hydrolase